MEPIGIITLIFTVVTAILGLYSRSKTQQVTIELTEKFETRIKEEKSSYALKIKDLNSKIDKNAETVRTEYATKEELKNMIKHIDDRFDDLKDTIKRRDNE